MKTEFIMWIAMFAMCIILHIIATRIVQGKEFYKYFRPLVILSTIFGAMLMGAFIENDKVVAGCGAIVMILGFYEYILEIKPQK